MSSRHHAHETVPKKSQAFCAHRRAASPESGLRRPLAYDLFAGLGGAAIGMTQVGLDVTAFERASVECESQRRRGGAVVQADVSTVDWSTHESPDLLWASPPCQPYSVGGRQRGGSDKRDGLSATLRAVKALRPPVVIVENVAGLAGPRHRPQLQRLLGGLARDGYAADARVLNCADFGVPQTRRRLFVVARRDGGPVRWPTPTHSRNGDGGRMPWVTMAEGLGLESTDQLTPRWPGDTDLMWPMQRPAPTLVSSFRPEVVARPAYRGRGAGPRQDAPGSVIISVTEALRLQGLPEGLDIAGGVNARYRQIGNAVPPVMAEALCGANRVGALATRGSVQTSDGPCASEQQEPAAA